MVLVTFVVFGLAFFAFYPLRGVGTLSLSAVPVVVAGWYFGLRAGVLAGLLLFPLSTLLLNLVGEPGWDVVFRHGGGAGVAAAVLVGAVIGRLHDLSETLRHELAEHQRAEAQLEERERRLRTILESELECVKLVAEDGTLLEVNPAGLALIEADALAQVVGQSVYRLIAPEWQDTFRHLNATVFQGQSVRAEFEIIGLKGTRRRMETHAVPLRDAVGQVTAQLAITRDITKRRLAEAALHASQARLNAILDSLQDVVWSVHPESFQTTYINPAAETIYGRPVSAFLTNPNFWLEVVYAEDRERVTGFMENLLRAGSTEMEYRIVRADGAVRWLYDRGWLIRDAQGEILRIDGLATDITERKLAAEELTALYNATSYLFKADSLLNLGQQIVQAVVQEFAQADCGLLLLDKQKRRALRLAQTGSDQMSTDAPIDLDEPGGVSQAVRTGILIYAPDITSHPERAANKPQTRSELVIPLRAFAGVLGVLDLHSPEPEAFSQRQQRILTAFAERAAAAIEIRQLYEDLSRHAGELEWRVAQRTAELHRTKDRVEAILNNSGDAIVLAHEDGGIQQTNLAFSRLFGYPPDEAFRRSLAQLVAPDQVRLLMEALQAVADTQQPGQLDLVCRNANGRSWHASAAIAPIQESGSGQMSLICNFHDITNHKRMEMELRAALEKEKELNELKSRFTSMISHEFRTPLATIRSSSDLLKHYQHKMTEARRQEHLEQIQAQIDRLTDLLDDVLYLGQAETVSLAFDPVPLDLAAFCQALAEELQLSTTRHRIQLSVAATSHPVCLDAKLLRQALTNLLTNAIKYSPDGGSIDFAVACTAQQVVFRIRDEGIGIPEADQQRLFEIFHRANNVGAIAGTGLGLAIVKRAVEAHNGAISVQSQLGVGTTFTITLPLSPFPQSCEGE